MGPIVSALCAVLAKLAADEIRAWVPWVSERLIQIAVRGLRDDIRDRYAEEWRGHLSEIPGDLTKIVVALGFIRATLRSSAIECVNDTISRVLGLGLLLLNLPLFIMVSIVVKFTSPGPILRREKLIGRGGRRFDEFSFNASNNRTGRLLRKAGLTHLPVILNIIRGELAFVGPAPIWPDLAAEMGLAFPDFKSRFTVKPGLAGWFQVTHTKHTPEEMVELDSYYVQNRSLRLDLEILARRILQSVR